MIKIHSTKTIRVTPNTSINDLTNEKSLAPDKINAHMNWAYEPVIIYEGVREYPDYIKTWNTVKALVKANILTISETKEVKKESETKETKKEVKLESKK